MKNGVLKTNQTQGEKIAFALDEQSDEIPLLSHWLTKPKKVYKSIDELENVLSINPNEKDEIRRVEKQYHMLIPQYYLSLIKNPNDSNDPVRKQSVPSVEELHDSMEAQEDPLGEKDMSPVSCLVHRYPDRALLLVTGKCFMYCRHCTRKRLWAKDCIDPTLQDIQSAAQYIRSQPHIREIIVSGGDPLTLATERLDHILDIISQIPHIEVIRIGTRTPVVFPQRIDRGLVKTLERYQKLWINLQFNHPNEITPEATAACKKLQRAGIPLSNQSVLLKGINDTPEIMIDLCHKLQQIRVRPYYLFQCDPVVGASHFRTNVLRGIEIIENMRGHTSGMCIPTFVVDGPEGKGKIPMNPNYILSLSPEKMVLRNYQHKVFEYTNPE
jgi:lysine 2,3-aminomutase